MTSDHSIDYQLSEGVKVANLLFIKTCLDLIRREKLQMKDHACQLLSTVNGSLDCKCLLVFFPRKVLDI